MQHEKFPDAVHKVNFTRPDVEGEGFAGYIETKVEFDIRSLEAFFLIWVATTISPEEYHRIRKAIC